MKSSAIALRKARRALLDAALWLTTRELDPIFYVTHYEDLRLLESEKSLRRHYAFHGRAEKRFPNKAALLLGHSRLADAVQRPGLLGLLGLGKFAPAKHWWSAASPAQLLAWSGDKISPPPTSGKELREQFERRGISELWPLRFDYLFDANFYVATYKLPATLRNDPSKAYRHFLTSGIRKGFAANETISLYPYLGGFPFPEQFDWRAYARNAAPLRRLDRVSALKHLFNARHKDFVRFLPYLGNDAPRILGSVGRYALVRGQFDTATAAFDAALTIADSSGLSCLLGDSFLKLGARDRALAAYQRSIATGSAPMWSYFHVIDILARQKDFDGAFETLRQAVKPWRHKPEYGRKLEEVINLFFQHKSAEAHDLYRRGLSAPNPAPLRIEADALLKEALDRISNLYRDLDDLPAEAGGQADGYVAILANDGLRQCTHYRIEQKLEQLEAAGIPVRLFPHDDVAGFMDSLIAARAAIFYRVAAFPKVIRAILHANSMGLATYYEIDDLIFDPTCYPDPFETFEGQIEEDEYSGLQFGVPLFRYALSLCKGSIASTRALAGKMQDLTATPKNVLLPNGLDSRNDKWIRLGATRPPKDNSRVRLFYGSGTKAHNADFNDLVGPALIDLMDRCPEVDLVVAGHLKLHPDIAAFGERVHIYPFTPNVDAYWSLLANCDINLAVLHPGEVADCKSEIKWLEAAILQIPSIVSDTATYRDVITQGVDGLIAASSADWTSHLELLVLDDGARRRMGAAAREKALRAYSLDEGASVLRGAFPDDARKVSGSPERKRLRILICNVFFHPQSHGGATRVVEDNVRSFSRLYDDLEVAVFCSDEGASPPGRLRLGSGLGIPVYRLSTPLEANMDWRPFNPENVDSFERVLDHFQPDIIHFHCIQRLTASIAEEALRRNIPYLVTLHDGWWISDHQFLVNEDGFLRLPSTDVIRDTEDRPTPSESIERRQRLQALLQSAAARLSVSAGFARIYENAGVRDIRTVENGLPELAPAVRRQRPDGRLALGHLGGRSAHKGAFLVEAALRQGEYENLHLTMVDGTLAAGEVVETIWGKTPVTLTGPFAQSRVHELYGQLNVLLAPSTWPESYGLVTREALFHGLWVVASSLGAIAEGIEADRNGFVIDTTTAADLKNILEKLNSDHQRYREPPEASGSPMRSMEEQATELHAVYWEVAKGRPKPSSLEQNRAA